MHMKNTDKITSILPGFVIALGISLFIDQFLVYHLINLAGDLLIQVDAHIWSIMFFWTYTAMSGIVCFVLLYIAKTMIVQRLSDRKSALAPPERVFFVFIAATVLVYAVASALYFGGTFTSAFDAGRFLFITVMWAEAGVLYLIASAIGRKIRKRTKPVRDAAESDKADCYKVHFRKTQATWLFIVMFVIFTISFVMLANINGLTRPVVIFSLCEYAFLALWLLAMYLLGIYTEKYILMLDSRGITVNRHKTGLIPWEDIRSFDYYSLSGHTMLGITIDDEDKYLERMSAFGRLNARQQKFFSDSLFEFDFNAFSESLTEVLKKIRKYNKTAVIIEHTDTYSYAEAKLSGNAKAIIIVLVAINVLIFIALPHDFGGSYLDFGPMFFGIDTDAIMHGQYYRLFTHAFIHANIMHLVANMLALVFIASDAFRYFSTRNVLLWYTAGIFGSGLANLAAAAITGTQIYCVGASGAIFGLLGGGLAPMLYGVLWVKSKGVKLRAADRRTVFNYVAYIIIMLLPGFFEKGISWEGHLGGLLGGLIAGLIAVLIKNKITDR